MYCTVLYLSKEYTKKTLTFLHIIFNYENNTIITQNDDHKNTRGQFKYEELSGVF